MEDRIWGSRIGNEENRIGNEKNRIENEKNSKGNHIRWKGGGPLLFLWRLFSLGDRTFFLWIFDYFDLIIFQ